MIFPRNPRNISLLFHKQSVIGFNDPNDGTYTFQRQRQLQTVSVFLFFTGHRFVREQVKNLIIIYQLNTFGMQAYKMSTIFSIIATATVFNTEQVCIGAIDAFSKRDTDLWNCNPTCVAYGEKIGTLPVFLTAGKTVFASQITVNSAAHINSVFSIRFRFNFAQRFIDPMDAVFAINHLLTSVFRKGTRKGAGYSESVV